MTPKAIGGYAYMVKYTDHHSRLRAASFIEEPPSVLPTADLATSQVRARQLALQGQNYPKQQFEVVSEYTRAVGMDKTNPPVSISVPNTYAQWPHHERKNANLPRPLLEDQRLQDGELTPSKLQHLEVVTTAPACKTGFDHRDCLANYLRQPP